MEDVSIRDLSIKLVVLEVTNFCNLNCVHCFNRNISQRMQHMSLSNIKKLLRLFNDLKIPQIWISGGEPFCHPNIRQIIDLASEYPHVEICFTTNGTLITKDLIQQMEKQSNIAIQFSVDGSTSIIHDSYRGEGAFKKLLYGVDLAKESLIRKKMARTCVSLINWRDIQGIYELCLSKNLLPSFLFVEKMGNAELNEKTLDLTTLQKIYVINELKKINKKIGMNVIINRPTKGCPFTDGLFLRSFIVKPNGDIACCQPYYNNNFNNIFTSSILDYYNSNEMKMLYETAAQRHEVLKNKSTCVSCVLKQYCDYGCMGHAFLNGNTMDTDGLCEMRKALVFAIEKGLIPKDTDYKEVNKYELEKTGYRIN